MITLSASVASAAAAILTAAILSYDTRPPCNPHFAAFSAFHVARTGRLPTDREVMAGRVGAGGVPLMRFKTDIGPSLPPPTKWVWTVALMLTFAVLAAALAP